MVFAKTCRRLLLAGLIAFAGIAGAAAQEISPDHLAVARKLVDLQDHGATWERAVVNTAVEATRAFINDNPDLAKPISDTAEQVMASYRDQKSALFDQYARIYAVNYSVEELNELIAFYSSDIGQKWLKNTPEVNRALQLALTVYENNVSREFIAKMRASLAEQGYNL